MCRWYATIRRSRVRNRHSDDPADKVEVLVRDNRVEVRVFVGARKRPANAGLSLSGVPRRRTRFAVFSVFQPPKRTSARMSPRRRFDRQLAATDGLERLGSISVAAVGELGQRG